MIAGTVFEIAFTTAPLSPAPVWVDCSRYLLAIDGSSGRQQDRDAFEPAAYTITLNNSGGEFHPLNTASPFWPNVVPMRLCRFRATSPVAGNVVTLFIEDWAPVFDYPETGTVTVTATDAMAWLATLDMPADAYTGDVLVDAPALWYRLDQAAGETITIDSSGNARDGQYANTTVVPGLVPQLAGTTARRFVSGNSDAVVANGYSVSGTVQSVELWVTLPPSFTTAGMVVPLTLRGNYGQRSTFNIVVDTDGSTNRLVLHADEDLIGAHGNAFANVAAYMGTTVHLVVTRNGATVNMYANGVALAVTVNDFGLSTASTFGIGTVAGGFFAQSFGAIGQAPFFPAGVTVAPGGWTIAHAIIYPTELSAARVLSHYLAGTTGWAGDDTGTRVGRILTLFGWPTAARVIGVGATILGAATWDANTKAMDYLRLVETTEQGRLYVDQDGSVVFRARWWTISDPLSTVSQGTFGDGPADLGYAELVPSGLAYKRIRNRAKAQRVGGVEVEAFDFASQSQYGSKSFGDLTGLLYTNDNETRDLVTWLLTRTAQPAYVIDALTCEPITNAEWAQVIGRRHGERITVVQKPSGPNGLTMTQQALLEGISHSVSVDSDGAPTWRWSVYLSPVVDPAVPYLVLDSVTQGVLDTNALAF